MSESWPYGPSRGRDGLTFRERMAKMVVPSDLPGPEISQIGKTFAAAFRHGVDPDPPRCWSCGHPFDAGCECSCCYDDHSEEPSPHDA